MVYPPKIWKCFSWLHIYQKYKRIWSAMAWYLQKPLWYRGVSGSLEVGGQLLVWLLWRRAGVAFYSAKRWGGNCPPPPSVTPLWYSNFFYIFAIHMKTIYKFWKEFSGIPYHHKPNVNSLSMKTLEKTIWRFFFLSFSPLVATMVFL